MRRRDVELQICGRVPYHVENFPWTDPIEFFGIVEEK
jgi:hypothetical protein